MNDEIRNTVCAVEFSEYTEKLKDNKIKSLLTKLEDCKSLIKSLKKQDTSLSSGSELFHLNRILNLQLRKKKFLSEQLLNLGYITDRRGRPKKNVDDRYKSKHIRMACYFTPQNIENIKELKDQCSIDNVSSFLNELIAAYFSVTKDGVINE
ncbi:MAG: hypothetical protein ACI8WT_003665 [Clostridium sp.]|jgi:hypothetical protein